VRHVTVPVQTIPADAFCEMMKLSILQPVNSKARRGPKLRPDESEVQKCKSAKCRLCGYQRGFAMFW